MNRKTIHSAQHLRPAAIATLVSTTTSPLTFHLSARDGRRIDLALDDLRELVAFVQCLDAIAPLPGKWVIQTRNAYGRLSYGLVSRGAHNVALLAPQRDHWPERGEAAARAFLEDADCDSALFMRIEIEAAAGAFLVSVVTVLQCFWIAEQRGAIPPLPADWWDRALPADMRPAKPTASIAHQTISRTIARLDP